MASMQDLEEHIKEIAANVVAQSFGIDQENYLKYRNYQNKRKRKPRFSLTNILETMKATINTDKEPIHHYKEKYGSVPPWILFKSIYFSTMTNFIDQFKPAQQKLMVSYLYNAQELKLSEDALCKLMMDTLFICMDYRNMAAHGGRIYNYKSKSRLRIEDIFGTDRKINVSGLSRLLFLLSIFQYRNPYDRLWQTLNAELNRHCNAYPEDVTYLGQILNVNITLKKLVWVSKKSNKYHLDKHCSGMNNAQEMREIDAKASNYIPCQRCCKEII